MVVHDPRTLPRATGINGDIAGTLDANYYRGAGERGYTEREVVFQEATCADLENLPDQIVRRLIPLECGRLQGFPDGWGGIAPFGTRPDDVEFWKQAYTTAQKISGKKIDAKILKNKDRLAAWYGKLHSRQAEYKMWGNGMALPNAMFFVQRTVEIAAQDRHIAKENIKLGSLFDGSGTMPLAAELCGARAIWASEVEPYPIAVTRTHLPGLLHLGSVTEIDGGKIPPVDIITFGSPCQDLSTAGKRAGMKNTSRGDDETTRSGLFFEAIRIARQMLTATGGKCPRFVIWENVPGALSSNAVADTGGESAGMVTFERKGSAWHFEPRRETQRALEQGRIARLSCECYQWHDRMVAKTATGGFAKPLKNEQANPAEEKARL